MIFTTMRLSALSAAMSSRSQGRCWANGNWLRVARGGAVARWLYLVAALVVSMTALPQVASAAVTCPAIIVIGSVTADAATANCTLDGAGSGNGLSVDSLGGAISFTHYVNSVASSNTPSCTGSCDTGAGYAICNSGTCTATYSYTDNNTQTVSTSAITFDSISGAVSSFTVSGGGFDPPSVSISVAPATLPTLTAGTPFSQVITSTGGIAPYTYTLQSGVLPAGVSLSSGGTLSGTPTQRGGYSFTVRSTDSNSQFVDKGYTGTVQNPSLSISPSAATAIQGAAFSQTLVANGGVAPHSYLLEMGTFPAGITISSAGVISGTTAAAPGNYPVTLSVTDSSTGTGTYFELEPFTVTVAPPPSVSIAVSPPSVSEDGATNLTYTVTRSLNLLSATVVNITTSGTATSGTDYTGGVATVTIAAGATSATITINPTTDSTVEANETVTLTVAAGTGYTVGAPASATATISNDDVPAATISVSPAPVAEDGALDLVYTVTLNQASFSALSVNYTVGGTAANGTDYTTIASPLVIPAGNTTGTITVNPTADATIEGDETVTLTLNAGAGYTVGSPVSATGTILNDDLPTLTINDVTVNEGNAGITNFTFTVSLSAPAGPGGVTFDIATANGSATSGTDYVANSLTSQTIPAGSSTYSFTVLVNGDTLNEPSEAYFVNVTNVVNAIVGDAQGVGTVANDDPLPSLSINDVSVTEGNSGTTNAVFTVTLSTASGQSVSVNYATADSTATQPADYASTSGTLTFTPGQTTNTITVPVVGEVVSEASETFFVNLSGATNATIFDNQGLGTITNDEVPPTAFNSSLTVAYNVAATPVTLNIIGGAEPTSVAVASQASHGTATASGTTINYQPATGYAGPDSFTYTASNGSGTSAAATVTITVNDPVITITASGGFSATGATAYTQTFAFIGGATPWSGYQVTNLPAGLSITGTTANTVTISGTPTEAGPFSLNVSATDSSTGNGPYTVGQAFTLTVAAPTIAVSPATVPNAAVGVPYSQTFTASGGIGPYTYAVTAGALPGGLTLSNNGTLSGTPTATGPFNFTITATDTGSTGAFTGARSYTINVGQGAQTIAFAKPADQTFSSGGTLNLTATATSGLTVTFASTTTGVCTTGGANGATVTYVAPGSCSITASQAGDSNYTAAADVTRTFAILQTAVTVTLTASQTSSVIGEPVTYTATVNSASSAPVSIGNVTFSAGGSALCTAVPLSSGIASCTAPFTSAGTYVVSAAYSGGGLFAPAKSPAVTISTADQTAKTTQAIGSFLSARNNQMLSNGPDNDRQIDRLMEAGGDGPANTPQNAVLDTVGIDASGGNPGGEDTGENFVSGFSGGAGRSALGAVTESRLGDGPGASDMARLAFGGRSRGFSGGLGGAFNSPSNPFAGIAAGAADDDMEQPSGLALPLRMSGSNGGPMSLGFATSLRDFYRFAADAEAKKTGGLSSGFASSNQQKFSPLDIWIEGKYVRFDDTALQSNDLDGHFGFITLGADYVLNRNLLVGMFVQFDSMEQRSNSLATDVSGHGWMAGPYATLRLSENVFWQARAAWGTSSNTISPFLTYEDEFDSERWLASSTLSGRWKFGPWSFNPSASISYIEDASDAYHDTFGVLIPGVTSTLGQMKAGPEVSYMFLDANGGFIEPRAGMELIWNFAGDTTAAGLGAIDDSAAGPQGVRGRAELGLKMGLPSGVALDLSGSYDGVGTGGDYNAIAGRAALHIPFD